MDIILIAFYSLSAPLFVCSRNGLTFNIGIARSTQTQGPFRAEHFHLSVQQEMFQQRAQEATHTHTHIHTHKKQPDVVYFVALLSTSALHTLSSSSLNIRQGSFSKVCMLFNVPTVTIHTAINSFSKSKTVY